MADVGVNTLPTDASPVSADTVLTVKNADGELVRVALSTIKSLFGTPNAGEVSYSDSTTYPSGSVGAEVSDLKSAISGGVLTPAIKAALLQLAEKVAYIDNQGQDYYQDLCDALYPLAELVSISAVFTQGQTVVYDTDSLDSLKSMLVVTATYEDSSTRTVPSSAYTLSGTLTVGTSTITASYGGKTDTFTVTVTEGTLYPLYNGSHSFNYDRSVVVTGGNHFEFLDVGSYTSSFANYINITDVTKNSSAPDSTSNINNQPAAFTIPAGATVTLELKNISATRASGTSTWSFGVRGTGTTTISGLSITGLGPNPSDKSVTVTIASSTDVGCVFFYARDYSQIAGDVSMTVNGVRYI